MGQTQAPLDEHDVAARLARVAKLVFELHANTRLLNAGDTFTTFIDLPDVLRDPEQVAFDVQKILAGVAEESGLTVAHTSGGSTMTLTKTAMQASQPMPPEAAAAAAELVDSAFSDLEQVMHDAELTRIAATHPSSPLAPAVKTGLLFVLRQLVSHAIRDHFGGDDPSGTGTHSP